MLKFSSHNCLFFFNPGNEEYLIQAKLGEGGFAKVYYVEREGFKKHSGFVVKVSASNEIISFPSLRLF